MGSYASCCRHNNSAGDATDSRNLMNSEDEDDLTASVNYDPSQAHRLSRPQLLLQYGILLFELFRSTACEAYNLWIPVSMQLSEAFFVNATNPESPFVDTTAHNHFQFRWSLTPVICYLILNGLILPISILTDSLPIRKAKILMAVVPFECAIYGYLVSLMISMGNDVSCKTHKFNQSFHFAHGSIKNYTLKEYVKCDFIGSYDTDTFLTAYQASTILLSVTGAFLAAIPPVLGGEQCSTVGGVRSYYTKFYLADRTGSILSGMAIVVMWTKSAENNYSLGFRVWTWFTAVPISLAIISLVSVLIICQLYGLSQGLGDRVVIVDTYKIFKQAITRFSLREKGDGILDMAKISNGGEFADGSVEDRRKISLLALTSVCMVPVASAIFSAPDVFDSGPNATRTSPDLPDSSSIDLGSTEREFQELSFYWVTYLFAGLVLIITLAIDKCCSGKRPLPLTRLNISQALMIAVAILSLVLQKACIKCPSSPYFYYPYMAPFGTCDGLLYTTGYELTLLAAPRSMQTISFGIVRGGLMVLANMISLVMVYTQMQFLWIIQLVTIILGIIGFVVISLLNKLYFRGFNYDYSTAY